MPCWTLRVPLQLTSSHQSISIRLPPRDAGASPTGIPTQERGNEHNFMMNTPLVALESTVISHGLPYPHNLALARDMEAAVRAGGAEPRTVGVIDGALVAGLDEGQLTRLASDKHVRKISRRDLPVAVARAESGGTTVAATMWIAQRHGIEVFATGGIGGVHRQPGSVLGAGSPDVSADLPELAQTSVIVVCAGAKAILDLPATLEYLETSGVTVIGWGTEEFPAFYSRDSGGLPVDVRCDGAGRSGGHLAGQARTGGCRAGCSSPRRFRRRTSSPPPRSSR